MVIRMPLVLSNNAEPFGFTCSKCIYRGDKNLEPEFLYTKVWNPGGFWERKSLGEFGRFPIRCPKCKVQIKQGFFHYSLQVFPVRNLLPKHSYDELAHEPFSLLL